MMEDKRRCHRLNIELPASFKASEDHKNLSMGTTFDISAMGLCIVSKEQLSLGQELPISIRLPSDELITVRAEVVWVKETEAIGAREYKIGIKILDSKGADESKFIKFFAEKFISFFNKDKD